MTTIRLKCEDGACKEVEGELVPGTEGLFALRRVGDGEEVGVEVVSGEWVATHVPTGMAVFAGPDRRAAVYVARQLYDAAPVAWTVLSVEELRTGMPPALRRWAAQIQAAASMGLPVQLLKGYEDFARDDAQDG
jgi:hypothetical protein